MNTPACRVARLTPPAPGAIAILHLVGDVDAVLASLGLRPPPVGAMRLVDFAGIDHGLIVRLRDDLVHLMPHGGPRVVQRLHEALIRAGAAPDLEPDPMDLHPEATDRFEALALEAITRAASPLAIDLLLAQPARWRRRRTPTAAERAVSRRLNRLLVPPIVVLAGPPNVGKSTLSNALLGRALSIAADEPGTTRDYTAGLLDLGGLVVRWHDTPGVRATTDAIEARAIDLASRLIAEADLVIAMTDAAHEWPALPRRPDLRFGSKADLGGRPDADGSISARSGEGLSALVTTIRDALVPPGDLAHPGLWVFDDRLDGC